MFGSILALLLTATAMPFLYKKYRPLSLLIAILVTGGVTAYFCFFIHPVVNHAAFTSDYLWAPAVGVNLSFYLDGLSLFFALLVSVFGWLITIYSISYIKSYAHAGRFFGYLLFFMGSMLGVVLSANLITLFIFWELTSFSSYLLIGFKNKNEKSRWAARQALLLTSAGGLALMAGFIMLGMNPAGGFDLTALLQASGDATPPEGVITASVILILFGAATKSAQFPFHFWLPNAMEAPTPVSAYLHSATMVKAGVYLIFRLNPLFEGVALWKDLLMLMGAVSMIWGAANALQADDLKKILAYTTISALGIFFMMTGGGSEKAIDAAILYVMAHALYKGCLFLVAGSVDHETGARKISALSDLGKKMPLTAAAAIGACLSMAGIIPFIGYIGKESLYEALHHSHQGVSTLLLILLIAASVVFVAIAVEISYNVFFKKGKMHDKPVHEASRGMAVPALALAAAGFIFGVFPSALPQPVLKSAAASIAGGETAMELKLWHGFNLVFVLSLITLAAGVVLYLFRESVRKGWKMVKRPVFLKSNAVYNLAISGLEKTAFHQTRLIQNGYLRNYISMFLIVFCLLAASTFFHFDFNDLIADGGKKIWRGLQIYELAILTLILIAVIVLLTTDSRLVVTATFGIIGYSLALAYTLFSGPDVAITQILAETLTLLLLILILHRLPRYSITRYIVKFKYLFVACFFGGIMAFISFLTLTYEKNTELKDYFLLSSVPKGKGENVVNVLLVDFRAFDTLGEISVLVITMFGIIALLKTKNPEEKL